MLVVMREIVVVRSNSDQGYDASNNKDTANDGYNMVMIHFFFLLDFACFDRFMR